MKVATSINQFLIVKMKSKLHLCNVIRQNYVSKIQNRLDALFKQIARESEYSDRGAAVFVAKHQRNQFHVANAQNAVCTFYSVDVWKYLRSKFKNKLKTFIAEVK